VNISANLATIAQRKEVLPKMLNSIRKQVDVVRVWCNDYNDSPLDGKFENVEFYYGQDVTDRGKFQWVEQDEYYLTCDDDLLYPPNYVDRILDGLKRYPNSIVSFHGRRLKGKGLGYYYEHKSYHCLREVEYDRLIDVPGSGVAAFDSSRFTPDVLGYDHDCMADILLGLEAAKGGVSVVCLEHPMFWLKSLWNPNKGSIYQSEKDNCEVQNRLADELWGIKY